MALFEVIEYQDSTGQELCHKIPEQGSGETRLGSQLVVREYQQAVFFRDGKGLDVLGPGRHTLTTENVPILTRLVGLAFNDHKSPFRTEVVFVNQNTFTDLKWGTKEPVPFKDTELGYVQLRAFGNFTLKVRDTLLFVNTLVGGRGKYATADVVNFLRDVIISRLNDLLGENLKTVFELAAKYDALASAVKLRTTDDFAKYGIELVDFYINAITPPEEVQQAINERSSMGAIGDLGKYAQYQSAKAMREAASNPGGAGGMMGAGLGAGMGMAMAQAMQGAMANQQQQQPQQPAPAPAPAAAAPVPVAAAAPDPAARLAKLKTLFDQGLITKEDYDAKRQAILADL